MTERGTKVPVAVVGATGMVGQQLIALLARHPWFFLEEVVASDRSAGRPFGESVRWAIDGAVPPEASRLLLKGPGDPLRSRLVFSCLGADAAREVEPRLALRGHLVVSNASAFRREPDVPLLIPEVNPESLDLLPLQRARGFLGGLVTNPNCVVAGLALGLAPLHRVFGVRRALVVTLQAASGAGLPGVSAVDLVDNLIPWIEGEEEKIAAETARIVNPSLVLSASVHRVPVLHGHTMTVSVELENPASPDELIHEWDSFRPPPEVEDLPTCPARPLVYLREPQRPQPRLDRMAGGGMTVTIGRLRPCLVLSFMFEVCVHNLVRGAAGAALLNGELCVRRGLVG